jgi:hypothetical protein
VYGRVLGENESESGLNAAWDFGADRQQRCFGGVSQRGAVKVTKRMTVKYDSPVRWEGYLVSQKSLEYE